MKKSSQLSRPHKRNACIIHTMERWGESMGRRWCESSGTGNNFHHARSTNQHCLPSVVLSFWISPFPHPSHPRFALTPDGTNHFSGFHSQLDWMHYIMKVRHHSFMWHLAFVYMILIPMAPHNMLVLSRKRRENLSLSPTYEWRCYKERFGGRGRKFSISG